MDNKKKDINNNATKFISSSTIDQIKINAIGYAKESKPHILLESKLHVDITSDLQKQLKISSLINQQERLKIGTHIKGFDENKKKQEIEKTASEVAEAINRLSLSPQSFSEGLCKLFDMIEYVISIFQIGEYLKSNIAFGYDLGGKQILYYYEIITKDKLDKLISEDIISTFHSDLQKEEKKKRIENIMYSIYTKNRILMIYNNWEKQPHLARRLPILKECLNSYINQKYYTCIPTLIAQTEGLIADCFHYKGQMGGYQYKKLVTVACETVNTDPFNKLLEEYIFNTLLVQFDHGKTITSTMSRHAILHGADVEYGTQMNALRAILMFDFLQSRFTYVSLRSDNKYHRFNCNKINQLSDTTDVEYFDSKQQAIENLKVPCELCCKEDC